MGTNFYLNLLQITSHNTTYIDKAENILRVPNLRNNYEEQKSKRKLKKTPKRTIQKIIKKSKNRRKLYINPPTIQPTQPQANVDTLNIMRGNDDIPMKIDNITKSNLNQRKYQRNYNTKLIRYSMPFQKLSQKSSNFFRRNKREENRKDVFILEDLDEVEFLSKEKDSNVIKAHVKKYW
ncbi:uncharacterized protein ACR2FA_008009 [Aphomia sociella]